MANVLFKRGLSNVLASPSFSPVDGTFYLTTDSNRLYIANGNKLAEINRYIKSVTSLDNLPTQPAEGDFVWVEQGNMLLVCRDAAGTSVTDKWLQVNPDTDTDTKVDSVDDISVTSVAEGIKISYNLKQSTNGTAITDVPVSYTIPNSAFTGNVGLASEAVTGGVKIKTNGTGSNSNSAISLKSGTNVTVSKSGDDISIAAVDTKVSSVNLETVANGGLKVSVTSGSETKEKILANAFYFKVGADNNTTVYNGGDLNVYTKSEVDNLINTLDGMTYKGTVNPDATASNTNVVALPSTGVKIGDMYKVAKAGTYGGNVCRIGDLLIAIGTEVNGVITSGLGWSHIAVGEENTDTQYSLSANNNVITLNNTTSNTASGTVTISAGNDIAVSTTSNAVTVKHADFTTTKNPTNATASPASGGTVTVLGSITTDNGHVTGYQEKVITLPAEKDTTYTFSGSTTSVTKGVTLSRTLTPNSGTGTTVETSIKSSSLSIDKVVNSNDVNVEIVWGTF